MTPPSGRSRSQPSSPQRHPRQAAAVGPLRDEDLSRELRCLHLTREETFLNGSPRALRVHTERMLELEREFAARFPRATKPNPARTRAGARKRSAPRTVLKQHKQKGHRKSR